MNPQSWQSTVAKPRRPKDWARPFRTPTSLPNVGRAHTQKGGGDVCPRRACLPVPPLPLSDCRTLNEPQTPLKPKFPDLQNGGDDNATSQDHRDDEKTQGVQSTLYRVGAEPTVAILGASGNTRQLCHCHAAFLVPGTHVALCHTWRVG